MFVYSLATPIVKASKNKDIKIFYNTTDYDSWKEENNTKGYTIKYYKGLGTSDSKEAKEYFNDLEDKLVKYTWEIKEQELADSEESNVSKESTDSKGSNKSEKKEEKEKVKII